MRDGPRRILLCLPAVALALVFVAAGHGEKGSSIPEAPPLSPHGDFIFRVTGTNSCLDCHRRSGTQGGRLVVLDNTAVRDLKGKAEGIHGPGRFADCFRCHAGGKIDRGTYEKTIK